MAGRVELATEGQPDMGSALETCGTPPNTALGVAPRQPSAAIAKQLAEARAGDATAVAALIGDAWPAVRRFVVARCGSRRPDPWFIDDVLQEALVRVVRDLPSCRAETFAEWFTWCSRVAWRAALDEIGALAEDAAGHAGVSLDALPEPMTSATPEAPDEGSGAADAEAGAAAGGTLLARLAVECQSSLGEATATVLWLRLIHGRPWLEIGAAVGMSAGAAKHRFLRALPRLRRTVLRRAASLPPTDRESVRRFLSRLE